LARKELRVAFTLAIIFAVLLAFQPLPIHAAATLIQQNSAGCVAPGCDFGGGSVVVSFSSNVASGNLIVVGVVIVYVGGTVSSVADTRSSTFAQAVTATSANTNVYIYVATLSSSGSDTVTVTFSALDRPQEEAVYIYEVSGMTTNGAGATGSGTGTSMSTSSSVAFPSGAFLLGVIRTVSPTAGAGFTLSTAPGTSLSFAEYSTSGVSSPTNFPATTGISNDWVEVGLALYPPTITATQSVPVGGEIVSVNQFLIALPWLALLAVLGVAVVGAHVVGQSKRNQN
jgi:hypothetical protein